MTKSTYISLDFMTEKKEGHGEDAPPLLIIKENAVAVGVFDGMGGAGAATCCSKYGNKQTKAYIASRIVKEKVEYFLNDYLGKEDIFPELLKKSIVERLKQEQEKYPPQTKSLLRSKLVRDYPTTMAVITLCFSDTELHIDSFWAGDSHCYLWTRKGFFQISKDDLEDDNDPMENLRNDAAISNCICADRDFHINHKKIILPKEGPVAILSATDGCFGYFPTPMHFEDILKNCLKNAKDENDWKNRVEQAIQNITGDDTSLSLVGAGADSFGKFKQSMTNISVQEVKEINKIKQDIERKKRELNSLQERYEKTIKNKWKCYKGKYMKYITQENDANA